MTSCLRRLVALLALLLPMLSLSPRALAQSEFPIQPLAISPIKGNLFVTGDYRIDSDERNGSTTDSSSLILREGIELNLDGYNYHPNLLEWSGDVQFGGLQQRNTVNDDNLDSDGILYGFNFNALGLKQKPISVRAFASRSDDFIDRTFARAIDQTRQDYGVEVYSKGTIPMSALFEARSSHEVSDLRDQDEQTLYARFQATDERNRDWFTKLTFEHEDTDETVVYFSPDNTPDTRQDLPDQRDELNLQNRWFFGPAAHKHSLTGNLLARQRRGFFDQDYYLLDQRLDLNHTETLSSFYRVFYGMDDTDTQDEDQMVGELGVSKKFYDSLTVTASMVFADRQYDDGSEQEIGGFLDLDYRKFTPIGLYTSSLNVSRTYQNESFDNGRRQVADERVVLNGITFVQLRQPNVDQNTIVVTDSNNGVVYVRNVDYIIRTLGAFTEIGRVAGGGIADGELVLVDYVANAGNDSNIHDDVIRWRQRIQLDDLPLAFYTEVTIDNETLDSGDDPGNLNEQLILLGGVELRVWYVLLTGEYEIDEEEIVPSSTTYRGRAAYTQLIRDLHTINLGAEYERIDYTNGDEFGLGPDEDFLETYSAYLRATSKLTRTLLLRGDTSYYSTSGRDNSELIRIGGGLIWHLGLTELTLDAYHSIYTQEDDEGTTDFLGFTVRRFF